MKKFIIDGRYGQLLAANGLNPHEVLKKAQLPIDTFAHHHLKLSPKQYFKLMDAIDQLCDDPLFAAKLANTDGLESFSPPILAAYCSTDGYHFIQRLAKYKHLIGPLEYRLVETKETLTITLTTMDSQTISPFFVKGEFAFLIKMLSKASKVTIYPLRVVTTFTASDPRLAKLYGVPFQLGTSNAITFSMVDLKRPFVTENISMLEYLEPELNRRLADLDVDQSYSQRVRNSLIELLPRGDSSAEAVARTLGISKRTLQRKLKIEKTNYQQQLNATREMLAKNYLLNTDITADEIAFLLAYKETNSFLRAFSTWTGRSVQQYRSMHRQ